MAAATELFVARGPARVSVREIAQAARVNHGLVHHYFGSKDGLLRAVLDDLAQRAAAELTERDVEWVRMLDRGAAAQHGRIMAHLVLEGREPSSLQDRFPAIDALVEAIRSGGVDETHARERAAQITALALGWQLFEPFVAAATKVARDEETRARLLDEGVSQLLS